MAIAQPNEVKMIAADMPKSVRRRLPRWVAGLPRAHLHTFLESLKRMQYTLTITDVADEEIRKAIVAPLVEYNSSQAGPESESSDRSPR